MEVTEATDADVPALCELLAILFKQEAEFRTDAGRQATGLRAILGHPDVGRVLALRDGTSVIGMATLLFVPSTALGVRAAWLEDVVVRPECRGRGAGERLLATAVEVARAAGCLRITLLTDADNEGGQRFYARHGFRRSAMVPMRLQLDPIPEGSADE